jgi:sugar phosphate permease
MATTNEAITSPAQGKLRIYPWIVAIFGMLILFLSNGMTATGITIYDPALLDAFGWSRGDFKFRDLLNLGVSGLIAPFVGVLIDRFNPKWLIIGGLSLLTLGYFGYSALANGAPVPILEVIAVLTILGLATMLMIALHVMFPRITMPVALGIAVLAAVVAGYLYTQNWMGVALKQVYMIHLLFAIALSSAGSMVVIFLVSSWFVKHRGLAIGIALVGTSLGSAVLPKINPYLIEQHGWREAFVSNAYMPIVLMVLVLLFLRGTPRHAGSTALGQAEKIQDLKQHGLLFSEAWRTRTFWVIAISGFLTYYSIFSVVQHLVLHAVKSFQFELKDAGSLMFWFSLVAMACKLTSGAVADIIDRHKVFTACFVIMLLGVMGLATMRQDLLYFATVVIAIGWGGLFTLYNMLAVSNFGLREIGRINGAISFMEAIGAGLGSWITGKLFDQTGSYQVPFMLLAVMVFVAVIMSRFVHSEVDERGMMAS